MTKFRNLRALRPLLAFLAFLALALSWSLGTPLLSGADEPEQTVKAAAVVRLEFSGPEHVWTFLGSQFTYTTPDYLEVEYRLPRSLVRSLAEHNPHCYAFDVDMTAACTVTANASAAASAGRTATSHMDYSPLYYLLVGWPSLLLTGDHALYGMRIASALITSALLAAAFVTAARRNRATAVGVAVAATPAVIYFGAVVNPSGLEIASAVAVWAAFGSLVRAEPGAPGLRADRILFAVSAATLVLVRPLGPAWLAMIAALVLMTSEGLRERLRQAVSSRTVRWTGAVIAVCVLLAGAWDATQNTQGIVAEVNPYYTAAKGAYITLTQTPIFLTQMLGLNGWNDVHVPTATTALWYGAVFALLLAAIVLGNRRERLALVLVTVLTLVFPIVFEAESGAAYGVGWQGRYMLPLAVGIPMLSGEVLGRKLGAVPWKGVSSALATTVGATIAVAYLCEVWWAWRRYAQGLGAESFLVPRPSLWAPPVGWPFVLALAVLGTLGLFALLRWSSADHDETGSEVLTVPDQSPGGKVETVPSVSTL